MAQRRKLTEAEIKRTEKFEQKAASLREQGYDQQTHTIPIVKANVLSILIMLPFAALIALPFFLKHGISGFSSLTGLLLFLVMMLVEVVLHEAIHGLTWGLLNEDGFSSIEFGFIKEVMTPYCYCGTPLFRWQYIIGSLMPTIILGFIQGAVSVYTGNFVLFVLSIALIFGGGGDFMSIFKMLSYRKKKNHLLVMDHPTELGFITFERD